MIRGIVKSVTEGLVKLFSCSGRTGETIDAREYMQHYGFTSRPLAGAEIIIINEGNHYIAVASEDRRYRLAIEDGEVALYTDEGDQVHMKRDNTIHVVCGNKLLAEVANDVEVTTTLAVVTASESAVVNTATAQVMAGTSATVTAPVIAANAATSCTVTSPQINLGGDRSGLRKLIDERIIELFNLHTHTVSGGNATSGGPSAQMIDFDNTILAIFNNHTHSVAVAGGTTAAPGTALVVGNVATSVVEAK